MPASLDPLTAHHELTRRTRRRVAGAAVALLSDVSAPLVATIRAWALERGAVIVHVPSVDELTLLLLRMRPEVAVVVAPAEECARACCALKSDAYTAAVPLVVLYDDGDPGGAGRTIAQLLGAGADDVLSPSSDGIEIAARLDAAVRRSRRDLSAQPTTRLPGPPSIEAELSRRLALGDAFAACYADLDHFKEFNDRYGYHEGDRVIRMVARLLYDTVLGVAGAGPRGGFVGHVGGDDFLCVVPLPTALPICELAVETFDTLVPLQYTDADRRAGYYFGKDRRGRLHRVPLMTLSIGVATTERRQFATAADVSRLASEMKSFAKSLSGSVFAFDRRADEAEPTRRDGARRP